MKEQPQIEYLSQQDRQFSATEVATGNLFFSTRTKIFVLSFLLSLLFGLVINYARPPVYQSNATLLTSAATAIDQVSSDVDFQHVAIQRQKLLSFELLTETLNRLKTLAQTPQLTNLTVSDIRSMLTVAPVEQTNLLSMIAEGPDPEILPQVINAWIDVYLEARALSVANSTQGTVTLVRNELKELDLKVEQAQSELDQFRKANDITSTAREENESLTKLQGLTTALNTANEEVVKAKARLDAVNMAIANGQTVVPEQEQSSLSSLEKRYQELKEKLSEFDKRYTREYLSLQPSLKYIPEQIKRLEVEINQKRREGEKIVSTQASQDYYAAKQVVEEIRQQLDEHKKNASIFTTLFSQHQKLIDDLTALVEIQRETRDRLVKIESKRFEKYPQVDVVERASINRQVVSPNYNQGALIAFISALFFAFFMVWLFEFLTKKKTEHHQFVFPLQAWFSQVESHSHLDSQNQEKIIEDKMRTKLSHVPLNKKLSDEQIQQLLKYADQDAELLILLLLSGLTLDEIIGLTLEQVDFNRSELEIDGEYPRMILFGERVGGILSKAAKTGSIWNHTSQLYVDDAKAMLYCISIDSGLARDEPLEQALRRTYILYLVEQGLRLTSLVKIAGYLSPQELAGYAQFSPAGEGCGSDQIDLTHPACALRD